MILNDLEQNAYTFIPLTSLTNLPKDACTNRKQYILPSGGACAVIIIKLNRNSPL